MLNRKFTTRETILMFICLFLFFGLFYYVVVYKYTYVTLRQNQQIIENAQDMMMVKYSQYQKMKNMEEEMASTPPVGNGTLEVYNNLKAEMKALNDYLRPAESYNISFSEAKAQGNIVRRTISISFLTDSYDKTCGILEDIKQSPYRSMIGDIQISQNMDRDGAVSVNTSVSIVFYETTDGAEDLSGLVMENKQNKSKNTQDLMNDMGL